LFPASLQIGRMRVRGRLGSSSYRV
jgi:hypothetical protein